MPSRDSQATDTPAPSPTPAIDLRQASLLSERTSSIDGWTETLIQNVRGLSSDPGRLYELTKRGF